MKVNTNKAPNRYHHHHSHYHHGHHHHHLKGASSGLNLADSQMDDSSQSPPMSPLRLPQLSSAGPMSSWSQASQSSTTSTSSSSSSSADEAELQLLCNNTNSKEDRSSYNTKFARYHLENYRQNDRMRWNFDFDHNRPLDDSHHHHHQTAPRYQWEPAAI